MRINSYKLRNTASLLLLCLTFSQATSVNAEPLKCANLFSNNPMPGNSGFNGAQFLLQRKQPDHTTLQVTRAVQIEKQQTQVTISKPVEKIQVWLARYETWLNKHQSDPKAHDFFLQHFYEEYVVKKEDIPQGFYDLQVKIYRETGRGDLELNQKNKDYLAEVAIADQKESLKQWVDYLFFSKETAKIPTWAKVWSFQGMIKLGKFNLENGTFASRSKGQTAPFPTIDKEAFKSTVEALIKKVDGKSLENITDPMILSQLDGANFGKLYGRAVYLEVNRKLETLTIEGRWVKYDQGSNPRKLVNSLACKNTGWCTAGYETAKMQLTDGDFYVYYSNNEHGQPTEPRIAIRMQGSNIGEIRGIAENQNLDGKIIKTTILDDKLQEFGHEGQLYKKRTEHMKLLTLIEQKHLKDIPLSKDEISFLYEANEKIQGFGHQKDPRITQIKAQRDFKNDLRIIYDLKSGDEISTTKKEVLNGKAKLHYGDLNFSNSKFPEGLILPEIIIGDLSLSNLKSTQGLNLPKTLNGNLNLSSLKSAEGLKLPEAFNGYLNLNNLTSAEGLKLPETINGHLFLYSLKSAQGLKLPETINGGLYLQSLKSAQGLKLPETINGGLYMEKLESVKGLTKPQGLTNYYGPSDW